MVIRATIFFATNIIFFSLQPTAIIVVIVVTVSIIITLIVLIIIIILFKLTICKVLNISSIAIIVYSNRGSKFEKKFFKGCYKSKQCKF